MQRDSSKPWFAPKLYGYGSGLPIAWQGWALLAVYFLIVGGATTGLPALISNPTILLAAILGIVGAATIILLIVCALKTQGGWRWRWGGKP